MLDFFSRLFDASDFVPRKDCGNWPPGLVWLHVGSDLAIWLAYFVIPIVLIHFARHRRDLPFPRVFWLFGAFIVLCGATHLMEAAAFLAPAYRFAGLLKLITALVSVATAVALFPVIPQALAFRGPADLEREVAARTAELERANAELRRREELLGLALGAGHMAVWDHDLATGRVTWSGAAASVFGLPADRFGDTFASFLDLIHPDDRERVAAAVAAAVDAGRDHEAEFRVVRPDGAVHWVAGRGRVYRDADGRPLRVVSVGTDVTRRRADDEALRAGEARFAAVVDNSPASIYVKDADGRYTLVNRTLVEKTGLSADELLGRTDAELFGPELGGGFHRVDEEVFASGRERTYEQTFEYRGRRYTFLNTKFPLLDAQGRPYAVCGIGTDVTDRREAERALRVFRQRLDLVVRGADLGLWYCDLPLDRLDWNARCKEHFGLPPDAAVTIDTFYERLHPEDRDRTRAAIERSIGTHGPFDTEYRTVAPNGRERWVRAIGRAFYDDAGRPVRFDGITVDVTPLKRAERAARFLARASAALAGLIDYEATLERVARLAVPDYADWCVVYLGDEDDATLRRVAAAHADPEREPLLHQFRPAEVTDPDSTVARVYRTGRAALIAEVPAAHAQAVARDADHLRAIHALDPGSIVLAPLTVRGEVLGVLGFFAAARSGRRYGPDDLALAEDLARRAAVAVENARLYGELQEAIRHKDETLALLDALLANAPIGFAFFDREHRYVRLNGFLAAVNGLPVEAHLGRPIRELPPANARAVEPVLARVFATGAPVLNLEVEGETPAAPGVGRHWLCGFYPVRAGGEGVTWVGAVVVEITDQKRLEAELHARAAALAEADRRKDEFLAMLAHELRNPLAPIRNAVQIMALVEPDEAQLRWARDVVRRQVGHMGRIVDDLLDVSRITRGKIVLRREPVDLAAAVTRAVETSRPLIDARKHTLTVSLPPEPLPVEGDLTRLSQVLANLLNNAAKYTEEGGRITVTVERVGAGSVSDGSGRPAVADASGSGSAVIRVRDTGVGIPAELLPRVFDLFTQAERTLDRAQGGLGIGLSLVKSLVELHGGTVEAHSDGPGQGAEFVVRLPLRPEDGGRAKAESDDRLTESTILLPPGGFRRVLVVDDNKDAAKSLALLLKASGHATRTAHHGAAALAAAAEFQPEVVLLDIGLPGMDGYEVAKRLRAAADGGPLLLVAVTGYGGDEARRRAAEAGFDHHLVKPVDPDALQALLRGEAQPTDPGTTGSGEFRPLA